MVLTLEEMGFEIMSSHHEIAPAQHEIDFRYDEALVTADNLMTFKMVVKTIANGMDCMLHLCRNQRQGHMFGNAYQSVSGPRWSECIPGQ